MGRYKVASIQNFLLGPRSIIFAVVLTIITIACAEAFVFTPGYAERNPPTSPIQSPQEFHRGLLAAQNSDYGEALESWNRLRMFSKAGVKDGGGKPDLAVGYWG
jgi:hypothetical protein